MSELELKDKGDIVELRPEREVYVGRRVLYGGSFWHAASHWGVMVRQPGSDWYDLLFEVVGDERPYLVKSKAGPMKFQEKPFIIASGGLLSTHGIHEGCISGLTTWTNGELQSWVAEYERRYPAYDLFNNNCQHFVEAFCNASVQGTPLFPDMKETSKMALLFHTITSLGSTAVAMHLAFMEWGGDRRDGRAAAHVDDSCMGRPGKQPQQRGAPFWRNGRPSRAAAAAGASSGARGGRGGREAYANAAELSELTMSELDLIAGEHARGQWLVSRTERERRQREREQERNRERCVVS